MSLLTEKNLSDGADQALKLLQSEKEIMEMIATRKPLLDILNTVALNFEAHFANTLCSILLVNEEGTHIKAGAAPSLPDAYNKGVDGLLIGPASCSCGTAIHRKKRVIVSDIANDPLWAKHKDFALSFGLKACWSTPIIKPDGKVLGTFAIYYGEVHEPEDIDFEFIDRASNQVKIALEQHYDELRIKQSEEKFRSLAETNPDYILRYDSEARHLYLNPSALEVTGVKEEDIIGKTHLEANFDPEQSKLWEKKIKSVFETGKSTQEQFSWESAKGNLFLDWRLTPEFDEEGKVRSVLGVSRDITEIKKAEKVIKGSEEKYRTTLERITDGFVAIDKDWYFTYMNKKAGEIFGLDPDVVVGEIITKFFPNGIGHAFHQAYEKALADQKDQYIEAYYEPHKKWYENHIYPSAEGISIFFRDITAWKKVSEVIEESERQHRTTLDRITDGFVALDHNWCYTYMNKAAGEIFNRDPEEMIGKHIWTEFPEGIGQPFHAAYLNAMLEQEYTQLEEYYPAYDKWIENHIYPSPEGLSIYFKDVTERKKSEVQLLQSMKRLELAEQQADLGSGEFDMATQTRTWSKQLFRIFGFEPAHEAPSQEAFAERIHPEDRDEFINSLKNLYTGIDAEKKVFKTNPQFGPIKYLSPNYQFEFDDAGNMIKLYSIIQDVTERTISEIKIKESEEKYRSLIENAADAIIVANYSFELLVVNKMTSILTGYSQEELLKMKFSELMVFEKGDEPLRLDELTQGKSIRQERRIRRKDGSVIPIEGSSTLTSDGNILGFVRDISERKEAERTLAESEEKYRTLVEQAADAIFIVDLDGNCLEANESASDLTGYDVDELTKMKYENLITPGDLEKNPLKLEAIKGCKTQYLERVFKRKDGTLISVEIHCRFMETGRISVIIRDVTDRYKAQEQLLQSMERLELAEQQVGLGSWQLDVKTQTRTWSKQLYRLFGLDPADGPPPLEAFAKRIHPDERDEFADTLANLYKGLDIEKKVFRTNPQSGPQRYLIPNYRVEKDELGNIVRFFGTIQDVTERTLSEIKIKESEEKYRSLVENASDAVIVTRHSLELLEVNNMACILSGYTKAELLKMKYSELVVFEKGDQPLRMDELAEGKSIIQERKVKRKDGLVIPIEISSTQTPDGNILGFVRDISERKKTERVLAESEAKYRTLVEQASDTIFISNPSGGLLEVNKMAEKMLGYTKKELLRLSIPELVVLDAGDPPLHLKEVNEGKSILIERKLRRKDGSIVFMEVSASRMQNGNTISFLRDLTERKKAERVLAESENRLRTILDSEPECVKVLNKKGELLEMNPAGLAMIEADSLDSVKGAIVSLINEPYKNAFKKLTKDVFLGKSGKLEFEITGLKGTKRWLETHAVPLKNSEGEIISLLGVTRDITDRKNAEVEILKSRSQFKNLIENISGVYWVNNLGAHKTLYVSPAYEQIWGRKCDDLYKNPGDFIEAVHPDDKTLLLSAYKKIDKTRKTRVDYRIVQPNGAVKWISARTSVSVDADGQKLEYGYAEDITDSRNAEETLVQERDKIAKISTTIPGLIGSFRIELDGKTYFPYVSEVIKEIYGFSPEEAGRDANQIFALIHPDDQRGMRDSVIKSTKTLSPWKHEYRYLHPIKNEIWLQGNFLPFREPDGSTIWHGMILDITEKKQRERERQSLLLRNRQTILNMLDGFILADPDGKIIDVNPAYCDMIGYTHDELINMNVHDIEERVTTIKKLEEKKDEADEKKYVKFETKHQRKDMSLVAIDASVSIMVFDGQPLIAIFVRDITEQKRAQKKIIGYSKQIRELAIHLEKVREEERASLSRELHDELGQQLTAIKMDLAWMNKRIKKDVTLTNKIDDTVKLVNDAVSSIRRINSELRPSLLDDLGLFAAMEFQMDEFSRRHNIPCEFKADIKEPQFDKQVSIGVFRIFQETLTNIGRHAKASKVSAKISKMKGKMELLVVDNGVGFDRKVTRQMNSFGILGMKERAMMMNGTLKIQSKPGEGTVVKLIVPIKTKADKSNEN